jgi:hypothetical protein
MRQAVRTAATAGQKQIAGRDAPRVGLDAADFDVRRRHIETGEQGLQRTLRGAAVRSRGRGHERGPAVAAPSGNATVRGTAGASSGASEPCGEICSRRAASCITRENTGAATRPP